MNYEHINADELFNKLASTLTYDNAQGNASSTQNKTSIYLCKGEKCLARMCNISLSNIDGNGDMVNGPDNIEDFSVGGRVLIEMLSDFKCLTEKLFLHMNRATYAQLLDWWYERKKVKKPVAFTSFAGAQIIIDDRIPENQTTVV